MGLLHLPLILTGLLSSLISEFEIIGRWEAFTVWEGAHLRRGEKYPRLRRLEEVKKEVAQSQEAALLAKTSYDEVGMT